MYFWRRFYVCKWLWCIQKATLKQRLCVHFTLYAIRCVFSDSSLTRRTGCIETSNLFHFSQDTFLWNRLRMDLWKEREIYLCNILWLNDSLNVAKVHSKYPLLSHQIHWRLYERFYSNQMCAFYFLEWRIIAHTACI